MFFDSRHGRITKSSIFLPSKNEQAGDQLVCFDGLLNGQTLYKNHGWSTMLGEVSKSVDIRTMRKLCTWLDKVMPMTAR